MRERRGKKREKRKERKEKQEEKVKGQGMRCDFFLLIQALQVIYKWN